jgi:hypothetical protein
MEVNHMSGARIEIPKKTCWMRILLIGVSHRSGTLKNVGLISIF